jgi:hypothetical protein
MKINEILKNSNYGKKTQIIWKLFMVEKMHFLFQIKF